MGFSTLSIAFQLSCSISLLHFHFFSNFIHSFSNSELYSATDMSRTTMGAMVVGVGSLCIRI